MEVFSAASRIRRELVEVGRSADLAAAISVQPQDERLTQLRGEIAGPPDTPYEGGCFALDISVPDGYPFMPPKVRFVTRIWHPNISSVTGAICLDILKDEWAATMTLRTMLLSLQALLCSPEPDDPQDAVVAKQYKADPALYAATARQWTHHYAGGPHSDPALNDRVQKLVEMGVDRERAVDALSSSDWDMNRSTEYLFN